jgi:hypothetical protein
MVLSASDIAVATAWMSMTLSAGIAERAWAVKYRFGTHRNNPIKPSAWPAGFAVHLEVSEYRKTLACSVLNPEFADRWRYGQYGLRNLQRYQSADSGDI